MTWFEKSIVNENTQHLWYARLERQLYIMSLDPVCARCVFMTRVKMFKIKANFKKMHDSDLPCPFRKADDETFDHIFTSLSGVLCKNSLSNNNLLKLSYCSYSGYLEETGEFLHRYKRYGEIML